MVDLAKVAELTKKLEWQMAGRKLYGYKPYPWQKEFHDAGKDHPERMLMAANRVGKCITAPTLVSTPHGEIAVGELYERGQPFDVFAWDGKRVVIARATAPFKKPGIHKCYRFTTRYGVFECADHHLIYVDGSFVQAESVASRLASTSGFVRSVHGEGVRRWWKTLQGFAARCFPDFRRDGEQLHSEEGNALASAPSQSGARQHISASWRMDGLARKHTSIGQFSCGLLSILDDLRRGAVLCVEFLNRAACKFGSPCLVTHQESQQPYAAEAFELRLIQEGWIRVRGSVFEEMAAPAPPILLSANDVITCDAIGSHEVYDFTVHIHHNYVAGGMVHHNTQSAAAEVAMHLTGDYPDWWQGRRFDRPTLCWTGSPTNETSRDIVQTELLGGMGEKLGTGWVPRQFIVGQPKTRQAGVKDVVDSFAVRHKSGGLSVCTMKTYEQGWQKWQGTAPHVVWDDEEPDDYMIYSESQTRILTTKGILLVTFTPLRGVTDLVQHFQEGGPGIYLRSASWDDAPHLSQEDKDRLSASYRSHERDARTKGIPMLGEGAVFPIGDDDIKVDPFPIPKHWARIKGCDFGMDHPAAGCELAHDREQDVIYLIDSYRKANEKAPYHAAWFNKSNPQVPVAWPHDGMNREKVGGRILADAYRDHGVAMLTKSARYARVPGEPEKGGPQPVEPIVDEMLERMQTGRFKAFSNQSEFFEEKRSYHRKDGVIVAKRDDILKAVFYAVMMIRYAVPLSILNRGYSTAAPSRPIASTSI